MHLHSHRNNNLFIGYWTAVVTCATKAKIKLLWIHKRNQCSSRVHELLGQVKVLKCVKNHLFTSWLVLYPDYFILYSAYLWNKWEIQYFIAVDWSHLISWALIKQRWDKVYEQEESPGGNLFFSSLFSSSWWWVDRDMTKLVESNENKSYGMHNFWADILKIWWWCLWIYRE